MRHAMTLWFGRKTGFCVNSRYEERGGKADLSMAVLHKSSPPAEAVCDL